MRKFTLFAACAAAIAACNQEAAAPKGAPVQSGVTLSTNDPKAVVAKIGDQPITAGEMDAAAANELKKAAKEYEKHAYDARHQALEEMIVKRLLGEAAKKKGMDEDAYFRAEVEGQTKPPTDAEAQAFYDKNKDKMRGAPFDAMKPRIMDYLTNEKRQQTAQKLIEDLKKKNKVTINLQEPEEERVNVAAVGPSQGPDNAKVTIVEFSDFQCPFCSKARDTVDTVMKEYKGKVRLVFRDYPLPFHQQAGKAAEAGLCANAQGKFWKMHDHMFAHQDALDVDNLKKAAKEEGLDTAKFDACLDGGQFTQAVQDNLKAGQAAGVQGTPHFFINGRQLSGAQPAEKFKEVIDQELARAK